MKITEASKDDSETKTIEPYVRNLKSANWIKSPRPLILHTTPDEEMSRIMKEKFLFLAKSTCRLATLWQINEY
ncbi:hypothetical protein PRIPAC_87661 [Pristionchus pacificus]|uniref:Uncharacterized protein n=1 Tax=Pristionchus pacificus TaxID=54126 RepID=A0A2A6B981_PRIPA|nr:hypothetical protein PRIPAC_87661 [Pristionchus pacificus]|eukprot:PDM62440.1 hypothetical protein PRIPAC_51882 [Pristionchus pacificus]